MIKRFDYFLALIGIILILSAIITGLSRCSSLEYDKSTYQCDLDCKGHYYYVFGKCKCEAEK